MTDIVQMEELEEAERQAAKPAWRTRAFWLSAIPLFVSAVLLVVGTVLAREHFQKQVCRCAHVKDTLSECTLHGPQHLVESCQQTFCHWHSNAL